MQCALPGWGTSAEVAEQLGVFPFNDGYLLLLLVLGDVDRLAKILAQANVPPGGLAASGAGTLHCIVERVHIRHSVLHPDVRCHHSLGALRHACVVALVVQVIVVHVTAGCLSERRLPTVVTSAALAIAG